MSVSVVHTHVPPASQPRLHHRQHCLTTPCTQAEKERIAAEKKAAKAAKGAKKGTPNRPSSDDNAIATPVDNTYADTPTSPQSETPSTSYPLPPSSPTSGSPNGNDLYANNRNPSSQGTGAGIVAQAWLAALPPGEASELGNPAIIVDASALDESEVFNNLGKITRSCVSAQRRACGMAQFVSSHYA